MDIVELIEQLNKCLKQGAKENGTVYIDYDRRNGNDFVTRIYLDENNNVILSNE